MFIQDFQYTPDYGIAFDVPDGEHKVKILEARETTTKKGAPMIEVKLLVNDSNLIPYFERIVAGEYFDKNMSRFFDAFKIVRGNFAFAAWRGKLARAIFKHEQQTYTGNDGMQKTVNKAIMSMLIVEQQNAQTTGQAQQTPPQAPAQNAQTRTPFANTAPQSYGQGQQSAATAQGVPPNMDDFPEDIPF